MHFYLKGAQMETTATNHRIDAVHRRIEQLMRSQGITVFSLAQKAGVPVDLVQKLVSNPVAKTNITTLESIAKVLNVPVSYLIGEPIQHNSRPSVCVPLLEWGELSANVNHLTDIKSAKFSTGQFIRTNCEVNNNVFALKMPDDTMFPVFPSGSLLIFTEEQCLEHGLYVLAHIEQINKVLFRQLIQDKNTFYLKSINPAYFTDLVGLQENDRLVGRLIQSQFCE
jgi:SOS-response transcriptional repressor LexA